MIGHLAAFLGMSALVIVTPGQDTALLIRNALRGGHRSGVFTALGVAAGQAVWALATSAGVVALLRASEPAFQAVRLAGAGYLVFLGLQALGDALGSHPASDRAAFSRTRRSILPRAAFRQGLLSNLGNPKMAVFFTSLLPQFAPHGGGAFAGLLLLGLVFCLLTFGWLTAYAFAVARAGDFLRRPRIRRVLDGLTGAVLVAFGLRLATEHR